MMQVKHGDSKFYIGDSEQTPKAMMTYVKTGEDMIIIDHTEVSDELRGQGAGYSMVEAAVKFARDNNLKILPLCPFAKSVFDKKPEYQDVLK
ncbi:N-acetyltransferase [Macrococcoides canis]|uniref:GNAT family N-acetyltransferase n=2 Tax=Macrococcoides canis TaxID=1855823 RepID=A0AAE7BYV7_9STAP|nr:GNAT family N-acetyltransferase [Macrococcus canis]MCO4096113.1 N-acetyltransferase [Macrococcus canis]QIH77156.1 GNAT family N-acetyltransferase [Macrococcus canis]QTQ09240.1 N-acetyltransferase [Macrococcus canis]QUR95575.1 GNAT family N-acetyltransferase [Macrococcus canis]UTH03538.1 N-acetyltransferase [Macrococcus canis]